VLNFQLCSCDVQLFWQQYKLQLACKHGKLQTVQRRWWVSGRCSACNSTFMQHSKKSCELHGAQNCMSDAGSAAQQQLRLTSSRRCATWWVQGQQQAICCRLLLRQSLQQLLDVGHTVDLPANVQHM
jgi:hypothetical protein